MTSQHKTIEQCAEECRDQDGACYVSYLAGAEKQKKLSDEREKVLMGLISNAISSLKSSYGFVASGDNVGFTAIYVKETIASVEKKLKELKGE